MSEEVQSDDDAPTHQTREDGICRGTQAATT